VTDDHRLPAYTTHVIENSRAQTTDAFRKCTQCRGAYYPFASPNTLINSNLSAPLKVNGQVFSPTVGYPIDSEQAFGLCYSYAAPGQKRTAPGFCGNLAKVFICT